MAVLLIIALIFLRWYKKKQKTGQLLGGSGAAEATRDGAGDPFADPVSPSGGSGMAQRSSAFPVAGLLSRFSGNKEYGATTPEPQERGFQRISGRKLPSAFSPGMSSEDPFDDDNATDNTYSGSFYRDSHGFYGGQGSPTPPMSPAAAAALAGAGLGSVAEGSEPSHQYRPGTGKETVETIRPSPARTPVVHQGPIGQHTSMLWGPGDNLSPDSPVRPSSRGTLGRSHPSHDGSRGSRFTEDV